MKFYVYFSCSFNSHFIPVMIIFMQKHAIICINSQHNAYLESTKMSIIVYVCYVHMALLKISFLLDFGLPV